MSNIIRFFEIGATSPLGIDMVEKAIPIVTVRKIDRLRFNSSELDTQRREFATIFKTILGLCEQIKSKWKIALDAFSSFYKCYIKGFPHEELFKLLEEHERVQINRNLGRAFSTDKAFSYYKTLYPNGVAQKVFEKGFLTNSGYTIDAKGKTKNLTAIVKEFIKKFVNPNVIVSFDRSMLLDYVESQMLSHANGYMWYANRGAWGEVNNIIIGMDMCLMFILESILALIRIANGVSPIALLRVLRVCQRKLHCNGVSKR